MLRHVNKQYENSKLKVLWSHRMSGDRIAKQIYDLIVIERDRKIM